MPATTPIAGLPYPLLGDAADIEVAVKPLALAVDPLLPTATEKAALAGTAGAASNTNRFVTDQDLAARVNDTMPIGTLLPYAGTELPPGGRWAWADGSLIDRTTYATFFTRVGHAYNGNVDPGSNKVKLPDKRGRSSVGAINYGAGAGPATNARVQLARGVGGGEVNHQLLWQESGNNPNGVMGNPSANHTHDASHNHVVGAGNLIYNAGAGQGVAFSQYQAGATMYRTSMGADTATFSTGTVSSWHTHPITAYNADWAHNNLHPLEADNYIVRIS